MLLNKTLQPGEGGIRCGGVGSVGAGGDRGGREVHKNTVRAKLRFITAVADGRGRFILRTRPSRRRRMRNGVTFCRQQKHESAMNYEATNDEWAHRPLARKGRMEDRQTHSGRRKGGGRKGPTKPRGEGRVDDGNNSRGRNGAEGGRRPLHGTRSKCRAGGWGRSVGRRKRRDSIRSSSSSSSSSRLNLRNDVRHRQSAEQEEEEAR